MGTRSRFGAVGLVMVLLSLSFCSASEKLRHGWGGGGYQGGTHALEQAPRRR